MAELYRKSALERMSNPEQLDQVLKVTSPLSWLALGAVTVIILVTLVWSFVGSIPETVTAAGIISAPVGSNSVYIQDSGTVVSLRVRPGDAIRAGDPVMTYRSASGEMTTIFSDQVGTVAELVVKKDDKVTPGSEIIRVTPTIHGRQMAVCYVPLSNAKKLERGMLVNISLDSLNSQSYGHMVARIVNIDAYATSVDSMQSVIGSGNNLESAFSRNGAVVAVACEFYPDDTHTTASGYYWSNAKGAGVTVTNGSLVTAKIITEEAAPITKLFSRLRDLWGD